MATAVTVLPNAVTQTFDLVNELRAGQVFKVLVHPISIRNRRSGFLHPRHPSKAKQDDKRLVDAFDGMNKPFDRLMKAELRVKVAGG